MRFSHLPQEIQLTIIGFLDHKAARNIAETCRSGHELFKATTYGQLLALFSMVHFAKITDNFTRDIMAAENKQRITFFSLPTKLPVYFFASCLLPISAIGYIGYSLYSAASEDTDNNVVYRNLTMKFLIAAIVFGSYSALSFFCRARGRYYNAQAPANDIALLNRSLEVSTAVNKLPDIGNSLKLDEGMAVSRRIFLKRLDQSKKELQTCSDRILKYVHSISVNGVIDLVSAVKSEKLSKFDAEVLNRTITLFNNNKDMEYVIKRTDENIENSMTAVIIR